MRATFISKIYDTVNHHPVLTYKYRNHLYEVIDYGWNGGEPMAWQHNNEQAKIDENISRAEKKSSFVEENSQVGLDMFFSYYGI